MDSNFIIAFGLVVFSILLLCSIVWNMYLMKQNEKLVNKLMSRNYGEYETAKAFSAVDKPIENSEPEMSPYDSHRATELNGIAGMG